MKSDDSVRAAAADAARNSLGKLVAIIAARTGDIAGAQDAVSAAFVRALDVWEKTGVPDNPEAWLLTVARNSAFDGARSVRRAVQAQGVIEMLIEERAEGEPPEWPDERLKLLFACAHPAIAPAMRAPLILQTILGVDAARIASAFLVAPNTMGVALSRAKEKIAQARIPFAIPDKGQLPARAAAVLDAVHAAYCIGWDGTHADPERSGPLASEALWLASLVARLLPQEAETHGLFALVLACEARRKARRAFGQYVPVAEQDVALWDRAMIHDAEKALRAAARLGRPGRYQIEAAIQLAHLARADGREPGSATMLALYDRLVALSPTAGARLARAAVMGEAGDPQRGLLEVEALAPACEGHQPWWAVRGDLLARLGRRDEAREAYARAAQLAGDAAVKAFLLSRRDSLSR